jgi:hypothetical protein
MPGGGDYGLSVHPGRCAMGGLGWQEILILALILLLLLWWLFG